MIVNIVLISVFSIMLFVSDVKMICMLLVWVIGVIVCIISFSVSRIRLSLILMWFSCLVWDCLCFKKKIMLIKISSGDSYERLKVRICVISVVFMLVFSIIIRVGVRVIRFWVINDVINKVVVLLFCISVVILIFV